MAQGFRDRIAEVSRFFGDSYRAVSEIDILSFSLGLGLGLLLGAIPLSFPGMTLKFGLAGGPLIVALLWGALGRSGPRRLDRACIAHGNGSGDRPGRSVGAVLWRHALSGTDRARGGDACRSAGIILSLSPGPGRRLLSGKNTLNSNQGVRLSHRLLINLKLPYGMTNLSLRFNSYLSVAHLLINGSMRLSS